MSFVIYDLTFLVLFCLFITIFLYRNRKNIKREGIILMYRSKFGIKLINDIAAKHKKLLKVLEYFIIIVGYVLMILAILMIFQITFMFLTNQIPEMLRKLPPIAPLVPYLPQMFDLKFLPPFYFTYWIIVLIIAATPHEFFHGIFAKKEGVKIKSTGFAFIGPLPGAFVEPDEKKMNKIKKKDQIVMLSAGTFANVLTTLVLLVVMWLFFMFAYVPSGAVFSSYTHIYANASLILVPETPLDRITLPSGLNITGVYYNSNKYYMDENLVHQLKNYSLVALLEDAPALKAQLQGAIIEFNGEKIHNSEELSKAISAAPRNRNITLKTLLNREERTYTLQIIQNPKNPEKNYLGIGLIDTTSNTFLGQLRNKIVFFKDPNTYYHPKYSHDLVIFIDQLIWWALIVSISVAIMNMLPLGIFDGGKVFYLTVLSITKSEKAAKIAYKFVTWMWIGIFLLLTALWLFAIL